MLSNDTKFVAAILSRRIVAENKNAFNHQLSILRHAMSMKDNLPRDNGNEGMYKEYKVFGSRKDRLAQTVLLYTYWKKLTSESSDECNKKVADASRNIAELVGTLENQARYMFEKFLPYELAAFDKTSCAVDAPKVSNYRNSMATAFAVSRD